MRRPALLLALALVTGCGYRLIGAAAPPDGALQSSASQSSALQSSALQTGAIQIGAIDDLTPHGDLGQHAAHHLRRALTHRLAPDAPRLDGTIRPAGDHPLGFDADRITAARTAGVELELNLTAPDGDPLWHSGPIRRTRPWLRGPDPLADRAARRQATRDALDDALTDALARLDARAAETPP